MRRLARSLVGAIVRLLVTITRFLAAPVFLAIATLIAGISLCVAGIYVLFGLGWSLIVGSVPFLVLATILIRGLLRYG